MRNKYNLEKKTTCKHIECNIKTENHLDFCSFHFSGGVLGNGETYEQYEIIEQDFIDFIKIIQIDDHEHLKVHSPVLRDIIIRSCIQIEVFFKEWAKFLCSYKNYIKLYNLYHKKDKKSEKIKGVRNWNFRDYFIIKENFLMSRPIYVRPMEKEISPFSSWETKLEYPEWWNTYNAIKHDGLNSKKEANLENALNSLAALFTLHCANQFSKNYLK